ATLRLAGGGERTLGYDVLVLATGSRSRVPPVPGLAERGVGFKTVQEAIYLRNRVLSRLDIAAELEDLARDAARSVPTLDPSDLRWVLVEATGRILPELDPDLAAYAEGLLESRGIEILKHTTLESLEGGVVRLSNGRSFPADTVVWTAGVTPSPLARASGFPVDPAGRVLVDSFLRVRGVEGAWAAGDAAAVPDSGGGIMPPTAQHGMRQGRRVAANLSLA